jgi:50S ribosomal subunit-associated GTPase HflX
MAAVSRVLDEVGAAKVPRIEVFNKSDLLSPHERRRLADQDRSAALVSAVTGEGCDELLETIAARVSLDRQRVSLDFDLSQDDDRERLTWLYRYAQVHSQVMMGDRAIIEADVPRRLVDRVRPQPAPRKRLGGGRA